MTERVDYSNYDETARRTRSVLREARLAVGNAELTAAHAENTLRAVDYPQFWRQFAREDRADMRDFIAVAKSVGYRDVEIVRTLRQEWGLRLYDGHSLVVKGPEP